MHAKVQVQRCRGIQVQRYRGAECVHDEVQRSREGAEVQRCRELQVQQRFR